MTNTIIDTPRAVASRAVTPRRESAPVRRTRSRSAARPASGAVAYDRRRIEVSGAAHEEPRRWGIVRHLGIAVVTAGIGLGLIGIANLSADPVVAPTAGTSVAVDGAVTGGR